MENMEYIDEEEIPVKKRKKKGHKLYAFFVLLFGIAIIVLFILILFYVQKVEVSGNSYCTEQEMIDMVRNDKYSVNTLYILGKYALGYGEQLPCLEDVKLGLKLPWVLKVTVKEKPIVGYVLAGDKYAYFDKDGMVVTMGTELIEGLPNIEGIQVEDVKLYQQLKSSDVKIFEEILETSMELKKYRIQTDRIVCRENSIYLYKGTVRVNLGNKVSSEQIAQITPILSKLEGKEGTLHLENYAEGSTTITFTQESIMEEN